MAPRGPGSRIICPMSRPAAVEPTNGEAVECKDPHLHGRSLGSGSRVREAGGPEVRFWEVAPITVMFSLGRLNRTNRTSGRSRQTFRNALREIGYVDLRLLICPLWRNGRRAGWCES